MNITSINKHHSEERQLMKMMGIDRNREIYKSVRQQQMDEQRSVRKKVVSAKVKRSIEVNSNVHISELQILKGKTSILKKLDSYVMELGCVETLIEYDNIKKQIEDRIDELQSKIEILNLSKNLTV